MNSLQLFLPCAAGVEGFLADEIHDITGLTGHDLMTGRGGVLVRALASPSSFPGSSTNNYLDVGAAQHQDPASGGSYVFIG